MLLPQVYALYHYPVDGLVVTWGWERGFSSPARPPDFLLYYRPRRPADGLEYDDD